MKRFFAQPAPLSKSRRRRAERRRLGVESLEQRQLLAGLPFGAHAHDTGEFMLGDVVVTLVAMESDGSLDPNLEDWNQEHLDEVTSRVAEGLAWWEDTLEVYTPIH